jgi:hypothetical protein
MYFEPQETSRFTDEEFLAFVLEHTNLNHLRLLGRARERRDVYLLTV